MSTLDDFWTFKRRVEEIAAKRERVAGTIDELRRRLKKDFGLTDGEADAALAKLRKKRDRLTAEYGRAYAKLKDDYPDVLEEAD